MRSKFSWEAGAVAVAAVYGCEIQNERVAIDIVLFHWNAKLRHIFINSSSGIHFILSLNLEVEAELHVIGEQLLRWGLVPVGR